VPVIDAKEHISESQNPLFVVIIEVRKNSPSRIRTLLSWQRFKDSRVTSYVPCVIYLADDKELPLGKLPGGKLNAGLPDKQPLPDDGTSVRDILLFSVPPDNAGDLQLRLDAERCGESGDIWFKIPSMAWKKK
jgi:hypothetical protein